MSTRSYICIEQEDGFYKGIYCHSDGYLTHNGAMLIDHYNSRELADKLIALGDIDVLKSKLYPDPEFPHGYAYDKRQADVTVAFGRDRGETGVQAETFFLRVFERKSSSIAFIYIFTIDNKWKYFIKGGLKNGLRDVEIDLNEYFKDNGLEARPVNEYGRFSTERLNALKAKQEERRK